MAPGKVLLEEKVVQVSAGDSHTAALTEDGTVYMWGSFRVSYLLLSATQACDWTCVCARFFPPAELVSQSRKCSVLTFNLQLTITNILYLQLVHSEDKEDPAG